MKSILVIDMPKNWGECDLSHGIETELIVLNYGKGQQII